MADKSTSSPFDDPAAPAAASSASPPPPPHTASSPPPPAQAVTPTTDLTHQPSRPAAEAQREGPVDPRVVALRGMFPDYDDLILQSVLASVGGNEDRAIDTLLGMSDPEYKSEQPQQAPAQEQQTSQSDLDEQLARRLMLEEQQQQTQQWLQSQPRPGAVPYQTRPGQHWTPQPAPAQGQTQGGQPSMAEFQEQFNKIAETGKKTFGNIFSKVKAKIQEFERPPGGQPSSSTQPQPSWGGPGDAWSPPPAQSQPAYYDPNPRPTSAAAVAGTNSPSPPAAAVQGYSISPSPSVSPQPPTTAQQLLPSSPPNSRVPPPATSATPIDGGKLGLLPKRPVSLLRDSAGAGAGAGSISTTGTLQQRHLNDDDDDDGLEYTENPFEESEHKK